MATPENALSFDSKDTRKDLLRKKPTKVEGDDPITAPYNRNLTDMLDSNASDYLYCTSIPTVFDDRFKEVRHEMKKLGIRRGSYMDPSRLDRADLELEGVVTDDDGRPIVTGVDMRASVMAKVEGEDDIEVDPKGKVKPKAPMYGNTLTVNPMAGNRSSLMQRVDYQNDETAVDPRA